MTAGTDAAALVAAHPLVRAVRPVLGSAPVCAVGGVVRDALLGVEHGSDLDVVVEGDALALARRLGRALGAEVSLFPRFGTAELALPDGVVDLVSARRERYERPGALPVVEPGTLLDDLARRDFTVNAMALGLSGPMEGRFIDPHDGCIDLEARVLRALRPGSFAEDPSRLVRAARYGARLQLRLDPGTGAEARRAAPGLDLGSSRIADETARLLAEASAGRALELLAGLGVPWVRPGAAESVAAIDRARATGGAPEIARWALRAGAALAPDAVAAAAFPGWARQIAAHVAEGEELAAALHGATTPAAVDALLRPAAPAAGIGALAHGARAVVTWWTRDRDRTLSITGDDLMRAGVSAGPAVGRGLIGARAAMLDGHAPGRDEQLAAALRAAGVPSS